MEPKSSRLPRRITVQPCPSTPLSTQMLRSGRLGGSNETYRLRDSSLRHESDFPDSSALRTSSRDWTRDRDSLDHSWKTPSPTYQRCSGTYDRPISGSFLANRSRVSTASTSQPSWYNPLERTQSTYTGLPSQQQDWDSKRPKLSYSGCTPLPSVKSTTASYSSTSDSSSRYGRFPRTSSVMLHSDLARERERERRTDSSLHGVLDHGHRNVDTSSSYLQDRVSSYAQGARPKENSLSTVRLNTSISRQLPSQSSSFRDSSRSSRPVTTRDLRSPQRESSSDYHRSTSRSDATARVASGRISPVQPRPARDQTADTEGRRSTRHLLSRLASSMSSTFFSRRSSQDSLNGRPQDAEEAQSGLRNASLPQSTVAHANAADTTESRPSEPSQGFTFLRMRRRSLSTVSPNQSSDSDAESHRSEDSETRTPGSWLPSSFRNRCTPLFSRRRREGRDETARASSTSDSSRVHNPFRRVSQETSSSLDEAQTVPQRVADANSLPLPADSPSGSANTASIADALFNRRNSGISGMLPSSFLHFSVPAGLGNSFSDNVMITVDIVPSGRSSDGQETEKSESSRDPEKLRKIQESLLLEDSEEEEDDLCRICQTGVSTPSNPFIEPCKCSGSLQYVHQDCMKKWLHAKINSGSSLETITTCELCKEKLELNLEDFDIQELYRAHASERADYEFISSGLYLVVLLHLCEQRFSDMLGATNEANTRFINLARTLQAHMDDLETSEDDSEDEGV